VADDTLVGIEVYQDHRPVTKETHLGNNRASQWHDHRPYTDTLKGQATLCHGRNALRELLGKPNDDALGTADVTEPI